MMKKVIIGCSDEFVRNIIIDGFKRVLPENKILVCNNELEIYRALQDSEDTVTVFDKYFLGYILSIQIMRLRVINQKILTYFVETGECSKYFGLRVYDLGIDGLIPFIEKKAFLNQELDKVVQGLKTFPEDVIRSIEDNAYLLDRKSFSEVTEKEMTIGLYLGMGKTQKEICYLTGMSVQAVSIHTCRLRKKIGYKDPSDYSRLCGQAMKGMSRSFN